MFVKWNTISIRSTTLTAVPRRRRRKRWGSPSAWTQTASAPSSWHTLTSGESPMRWCFYLKSLNSPTPAEPLWKLFPLKSFGCYTSRESPQKLNLKKQIFSHIMFHSVLSVLINTYVHSYTVQWLTVQTTWITCLKKSLWLFCLNSIYCAVIQMHPLKVLCVLKQKDICYLKKEKKMWIFSFYVGAYFVNFILLCLKSVTQIWEMHSFANS